MVSQGSIFGKRKMLYFQKFPIEHADVQDMKQGHVSRAVNKHIYACGLLSLPVLRYH